MKAFVQSHCMFVCLLCVLAMYEYSMMYCPFHSVVVDIIILVYHRHKPIDQRYIILREIVGVVGGTLRPRFITGCL
jgi:hypothetical protein